MAVAKDALTTSSLTSYTHTPVGTPRGVLVVIVMANATDVVTGVTYGGTAMTEITNSPLVAGGSEGGTCYGYFLGSSVPTGAQTVAITVSAGTPRSLCQSVTAAADTEIINTATINDAEGAGGSGSRTVNLALSGRTGVVLEVVWSEAGAVTDLTPLAGWTSQVENDEGSETNARYTYDTVGSTDVTCGFTSGVAADVAVLAAAIGEVSGSTYTLAADGASYTYTATAASLELGREVAGESASYAYTATAATLNKGRTVVADAASYAWTATAAALELGREVVADAASYLWSASDAALTYTPAASASQPLTYGAGRLPVERVRRKWEEIEEIDRQIKAKEDAEREKVRKQEEAKRQLAELEEKKRQTKTIAERRRKLEARIAAYQSEITELRETMVALMDEIERARAETELQQTIADRRLRMLLLIAAAA